MPMTAKTDSDDWTSFYTAMGSFTGSSIPSPTGWITAATSVSAVSSDSTIAIVSNGITESIIATVPSAATITPTTATYTPSPVLTITPETTLSVSAAPTATSSESQFVTLMTPSTGHHVTTADWTLTLGTTVPISTKAPSSESACEAGVIVATEIYRTQGPEKRLSTMCLTIPESTLTLTVVPVSTTTTAPSSESEVCVETGVWDTQMYDTHGPYISILHTCMSYSQWTHTPGSAISASHTGEVIVTASTVATAFVTVYGSTTVWVEPSTRSPTTTYPVSVTTVVSCEEVDESQGKVNLWC